jgi:hypothetical protein
VGPGSENEKWQGRKDSNLGPSVLETDALTRLSYAPSAEMEFYATSGAPFPRPISIEAWLR